MAALNLPSIACYEVHENVCVDTSDNEDHTFCGIMFPVEAKADLPVSRLVIRSLSVRGELGPMTVWVSNEDAFAQEGYESQDASTLLHRIREDSSCWTKIYERNYGPSRKKYKNLDLSSNPILFAPGQMRLIYIHSAAQHDMAIVYDNSKSMTMARYSDDFLTIHSGAAHLSPEPFHDENIWGWGIAWRNYREFVGQIEFGAVYQLWTPERHGRFGSNFQDATTTIMACQRRLESPISMLPDECIYYILNMCRWDWFNDTADHLSTQKETKDNVVSDATRRRTEVERQARERRTSRRWRTGLIESVRDRILDALS